MQIWLKVLCRQRYSSFDVGHSGSLSWLVFRLLGREHAESPSAVAVVHRKAAVAIVEVEVVEHILQVVHDLVVSEGPLTAPSADGRFPCGLLASFAGVGAL